MMYMHSLVESGIDLHGRISTKFMSHLLDHFRSHFQ